MALVLLGSHLFADGLSNAILLPLAVTISGLSGAPGAGSSSGFTNQIILQLAFGIICLAGSVLFAFFKIDTLNPRVQVSSAQVSLPQLSKPSTLTTEELISELKLRMPRNWGFEKTQVIIGLADSDRPKVAGDWFRAPLLLLPKTPIGRVRNVARREGEDLRSIPEDR